MDAGRIAQAGSPQQLYETPGSEFVAGFMGEAMLFAAQAEADGSVRLGPLRFTPRHAVRAGAVQVAVRPEAWQLLPPTQDGLSGVVLKCSYLGSLLELTLNTELGEIFVISADVARLWAVGEHATLRLAGHGLSVVAAGAEGAVPTAA